MQSAPTLLPTLPTAGAAPEGASTTAAPAISGDPFALIFARLLQLAPDPTGITGATGAAGELPIPTGAGEGGADFLSRILNDPVRGAVIEQLFSEVQGLESPTQGLEIAETGATSPASTYPGPAGPSNLSPLPPLTIENLAALLGSRVAPPTEGEDSSEPVPLDPTKGSSTPDLTKGDVDLTSFPIQRLLQTPEWGRDIVLPTQRTVPTTNGEGAVSQTFGDRVDKDSPRRLLQPFQPSLAQPRFVDPRVDATLNQQSQDLPTPTSIASALGADRPGRIIVDKDILRAVDKLLGRTTPKSDILEKGVSVLTPQELKAEGVSVEHRSATALARVDRSEFVERVVQALERARAEAPKRIEIELHPPSLGKVKLQVTEQDGHLTAKIEVQSATTRSILLDNLPTLDRHLGEHGVQIQRFQVDQTNTGSNGTNDPNGGAGMASGGDQTPTEDRSGPKGRRSGTDEDHPERGPPLSVAELFGLADGMDRLV